MTGTDRDDRRAWDPANYGDIDRDGTRGGGGYYGSRGQIDGQGADIADSDLREAVLTALPGGGRGIAVEVISGVVMLEGRIATEEAKRDATTRAAACAGVAQVLNNLRVTPGG